MDLTASVLAATATPVPEGADLEGVDLFPVLRGLVPEIERTLFWRTSAGGQRQKAVRSGDWKLVIDGTHQMVFNVRRDLGERNAGNRSTPSRSAPSGTGVAVAAKTDTVKSMVMPT